MAKKSQQLRTDIILGGKVDNSFTRLGQALDAFGNQTNEISRKLISFGTDALNVYREYEDGILETRSVWKDLYSSTTQLDKAMDSLEAKAQEWASTSIFHTNDVSEALANAAHAGWNYQQMIEGIPAAMLLAQAGNMDLAESVDYISKTLNSTGTAFDDAEDFLDSWAKAANLVSTDIPELGDALRNLGSTAQLADSTDEVMTFLAALGSVGTVGATAGTHLRAVFLRLVAPTKAAAEAMDLLNLSEEELDEAFEDITEESNAAYQQLESLGFSAYDQQGNLKSFIELFTDLDKALSQIETDEERNNILATLFPQRTFSDAQTFLNMVRSGELQSMYQEISDVESGYMQDIADTRMSGLTGATEIFNSKIEELKRRTGETLSTQAESVYGWLGGFLDSINTMDQDKFDTIISGLEGFALTAPTLLIAGKALSFIGSLFSPVGMMGVGLAAAAGWTMVAEKMSDLNMAENFGNMALDADMMSGYIENLGSDYRTAYADVYAFNSALEQCVIDYENASSALSSGLMTAMITGITLSDEQITSLNTLGDNMYKAVVAGIENSTASDMSFWTAFFGGEGTAETDPNYQSIIDLENQGYLNMLAEAKTISQNLRNALTSAFDDGEISQQEYDELLGYFRQYNELMAKAAAQAAEEENQIAIENMLFKAQTASWDEIQQTAEDIQAKVDENVKAAEDNYITKRSRLKILGDADVANGTMTQDELDAMLAETDRMWNEEQLPALQAEADDNLRRLYETAMKNGDLSDPFNVLQGYAEQVLSGTMDPYEAVNRLKNMYGYNGNIGEPDSTGRETRTQLSTYIADMIAAFGGTERIAGSDNEWLKTLYAMQQIVDEFSNGENIYSNALGGSYNYGGYENFKWWMGTGDTEKPQSVAADNTVNILNEFLTGLGHFMNANMVTGNTGITVSDSDQTFRGMVRITQDTLDNSTLTIETESIGLIESTQTEVTNAQKYLDDHPGKWKISKVYGTEGSQLSLSGGLVGSIKYNSIGMYAEGGRADEPSIFGEAGAEWAIPEEHTQNTAALLAQAAQASGFTWQDIAAASGSSNGGGTLVYSPTIIAKDATGVEEKLIEDKKRMDDWFRSRRIKDDIAVYA